MNEKSGRYSISVVIVTYNNQDHIERCIKSLSGALQDYTSELVIIDNNSVDGTVNMVGSTLSGPLSFNSTRFIENRHNTGFTFAINQGLKQSSGDYLLIMNPDIICTPDVFLTLFREFDGERIGVVAPQLRDPDNHVQASCRRFPKKSDIYYELSGLARALPGTRFNRWKMPDFDHRHSKMVEQPQGAFLLIKKQVLEKTGLLDERFYMFFSDVDWCRRIYEQGYIIRYNSEVFVYHYKGVSIYPQRERMIVSSHRSFVDYFAKYDTTWFDRAATRILHFLLLTALVPRLLLTRMKICS